MPIVHMIFGYLGAGKTTFAKKLEQDCRAVRFSNDEWVRRICGPEHPDSHEVLEAVRDLIDQYWTRCVQLGLDVVLDAGFWSRASRDSARSKATALGAEYRLYFVFASDEVAWARVEKRNKDPLGSWVIDRNAFDTLKTLRGFDPLGADEPHIPVNSEDSRTE